MNPSWYVDLGENRCQKPTVVEQTEEPTISHQKYEELLEVRPSHFSPFHTAICNHIL